MEYGEALELLKKHVKTKNLVKHCIAVSGCMGKLAEHFGEDIEKWKITGLLHDLDYEVTKDDPARHGLETVKILEGMGFERDILDAIKAHPGHKPAETKMEISLYAADPLSGLIVASALMHPSKSLKGIDVPFIVRRFKEKRFAAGANREQIRKCEKLGISLEKFIELCLEGMREVSDDLGL